MKINLFTDRFVVLKHCYNSLKDYNSEHDFYFYYIDIDEKELKIINNEVYVDDNYIIDIINKNRMRHRLYDIDINIKNYKELPENIIIAAKFNHKYNCVYLGNNSLMKFLADIFINYSEMVIKDILE